MLAQHRARLGRELHVVAPAGTCTTIEWLPTLGTTFPANHDLSGHHFFSAAVQLTFIVSAGRVG